MEVSSPVGFKVKTDTRTRVRVGCAPHRLSVPAAGKKRYLGRLTNQN